MNLLLDTHILLWALAENDKLPAKAKELILNKANTIIFSIASMWEIAIKHQIKPEAISLSGTQFLHYCEQSGYSRISIKDRHIIELEKLPPIHKDPFDRILIAQAVSENMTLITHNKIIASYNLQEITVV